MSEAGSNVFVFLEKYNKNMQKPLFCKVFDKHILVQAK